MDSGRHEDLKSALAEHDELPAEERAAWLAALAQRDPGLAEQVRHWIGIRTRGPEGRGLSAVVEAAAAAADPHREARVAMPDRIGPYRILDLLGSGGMGVVYRAEQQEPLRREVALKVLRGGIAPEALIRRFQVERRALAMMEHPGIARVLDAGIDEHGTPFVAMELVHGQPIVAYCQARALPVRARVALFVEACRAVQHAHQKGVVHRDLKPSNILVAESDGRPNVKVIDFGVARLVGEEGALGGGLTHQGQIIGTLGYMSPEQAEGRIEAIDTRTDVYALGAVLYELLTAALPHDLEGLGPADALRAVSASPLIPPRRRAGVSHDLDADLEAILLKALAQEPSLRYDGPGPLADDVERWLRFQPVLAQPPSTLYQLRKLVQRHRAGVGVAAAALVLLVAFGVAMAILYTGQREARARAQAEADKATAINAFLQETIGASDPFLMGRKVTVQEVVDRALPRLERELAAQPEILAGIQTTLGVTYRNLGVYARADSLLRRALAVQRELPGRHDRETAAILMELARTSFEWRHLDQADSAAREALVASERAWTRRSPQVAAGLILLADIQDKLGAPAATESLLAEAIPMTRELHGSNSPELGRALMVEGHQGWSTNDLPRAERGFGEAVRIFRSAFGDRHPETLMALHWWQHPLGALGRPTPAEWPAVDLVELNQSVYGREHPRVAEALMTSSYGSFLGGRFDEAERMQMEAIGIVRRTMGDSAYLLNRAYGGMAGIREARKDLAGAERWARRFLAVAEAIPNAPTHPWRIVALEEVGRLVAMQGRPAEAEPFYRQAVDVRRRTTALGGIGGVGGGSALRAYGAVLFDLGRLDSAEVMMREALATFRTMPNHPDIIVCTTALGICLASRGRSPAADSLLREARTLAVSKDVPVLQRRRSLERLARFYERGGRSRDAAQCRAALRALPS